MSDTWSSIQAHKKQLDSLRERLQRRRKDTTQLGIDLKNPDVLAPSFRSDSPIPAAPSPAAGTPEVKIDLALEKRLLEHLSDLSLVLPTDSLAIRNAICTESQSADQVIQASIESLLQKFAAQELIEVKDGSLQDGRPTIVIFADQSKLSAMMGAVAEKKAEPAVVAGAGGVKRRAEQEPTSSCATVAASSSSSVAAAISFVEKKLLEPVKKSRKQASYLDLEIESLLSQQSTKEQQSKKVSQEILELLNTTTAKEQSIVEKFRSRGRAQVQEFCDHGTKEDCMKENCASRPCKKLHFRRIINKHTDESLGDCSFLNTCFHMDTCKYVHYEIDCCAEDEDDDVLNAIEKPNPELALVKLVGGDPSEGKLFPPQWICCDIRYLDVSILGKFAVVMADPPWDIHMELPYGTLTDDEMRKLNIPVLQDDGFLFLWVTGRAMELGRECLKLWGYERVDEIIWVKTNQLQRIIRTGRTGHWLNHGKEHCLVGVKGNPQGFNRGLDCDVIVAEVRSTSHKPDEIYGMIERLSPGTRKIELFGRPHNVQPNWITLGNQLDGIHLLDPDVVARFKKRYPDGVISKPKNM
ncbi:N6-adenosine-methyltransferase subunit METTL3 [Latimeria chalumnae]|uniref:mRNA m(6)A methyltransferase n=1 Tax=Latimeria chalumnae TaxID=7897 RepID=H3B2A0_LATCH|nr:PREDICTED: N6-adenosine-methyltransferase 70 kDa subunit [Latimeria chalumnae]|eukprot:XP_006001301.1 PREDICTED: N6-adenosine-methyltransferase 70 kDa subunit [Latimeria chalumnae]